jgi:hypothetical protein
MTALDDAGARERLSTFRAELAARSRPVHIVAKRAYWHQRVADVLLRVLTFGGQSTYLTRYVTTLGHTIYVPDGFDDWPPGRAWEVLRHEAVHVAQFERIGWFGMVVLYGLVPFPVGLAYGRARLEWEAYRESLRAVAELEGIDAARAPAFHDEIVRRFTGPDYGWMWPFPRVVRGWIADALDEIARDQPSIVDREVRLTAPGCPRRSESISARRTASSRSRKAADRRC